MRFKSYHKFAILFLTLMYFIHMRKLGLHKLSAHFFRIYFSIVFHRYFYSQSFSALAAAAGDFFHIFVTANGIAFRGNKRCSLNYGQK